MRKEGVSCDTPWFLLFVGFEDRFVLSDQAQSLPGDFFDVVSGLDVASGFFEFFAPELFGFFFGFEGLDLHLVPMVDGGQGSHTEPHYDGKENHHRGHQEGACVGIVSLILFSMRSFSSCHGAAPLPLICYVV